MKVKHKIKLYLYRQELSLGADNKWSNNVNHKIKYILSPRKLNVEYSKYYEDTKDKYISYSEYAMQHWTPYYTNIAQDCYVWEETQCDGWGGLFNMLPILNDNMFAELIFTVEYDSDETGGSYYSKKLVEKLEKINFTAIYDCMVLYRGDDDIMLGFGDDEPDYEFDDGSVKWDVGDRTNATLIFMFKTFGNLFAYNKTDYHGFEKPYKASIKIEGNIQRF